MLVYIYFFKIKTCSKNSIYFEDITTSLILCPCTQNIQSLTVCLSCITLSICANHVLLIINAKNKLEYNPLKLGRCGNKYFIVCEADLYILYFIYLLWQYLTRKFLLTSQTSGHIIDEVGGRGGEPRPLQTPHHPEGVKPQLQGEAVPTPPSWRTQLPTQQLLQLLYLEPASKIVETYGSLENPLTYEP